MHFWQNITALGDSGLAVTAGICIAIWLLISNRIRLASIWVALLGIGILFVTVSKLLFMGWGIGVEAIDFTGISGHTTLAACVLPVLARLTAGALRPGYTGPCFYLGEVLAVLVGFSRLMIHVHSVSEVVAGFVLGFTLSYLFLAVLRNSIGVHLKPWLIGISVVAMLPLPARGPTPSHRLLEQIAMALSGRTEVYRRQVRVDNVSPVTVKPTKGG